MQSSLSHHQSHWIQIHGGLPRTEDDMASFGDGPNVTAGWILTGWIPILGGVWVGRRFTPSENKKT